MRLLSLLFVLALAPLASGQEAVRNGAFRDGLEPWQRPPAASAWGTSLEARFDANVTHDPGTGSAVFFGRGSSRGMLYQDLPAGRAGKVRLSCWVKMENFDPGWDARAVLLWSGDRDGSARMVATPSASSSNEWRLLETVAEIPEGVRRIRLTLETAPSGRAGGKENSGIVWFDEAGVEYLASSETAGATPNAKAPANLVAWPAGESLGIYAPGEPIQIAVIVPSDFPTDGVFDCRIEDYDGGPATDLAGLKGKIESAGKAVLDLPAPARPGFYVVTVLAKNTAGEILGKGSTGIGLVEPITDRDPFFSFSGFRNHPWMAEAVKRLGAGSNMFFTNWRATEPTKGQYNFGEFDAWLRANEAAGLRTNILEIFASAETRDWVTPQWEVDRLGKRWSYDPEHLEAYSRRVRELASRYGKRISTWVLHHEVASNSRDLDQVIEYDVNKTKAFVAGLRSVIPDAVIAGVGVSGREQTEDFKISKIFWSRLNGDLQIFTPHNYSLGRAIRRGSRVLPPEDFLPASIRGALEVIRPYKNKALGNDENGYSLENGIPLNDPLQRLMANLAARAIIIHRAEPLMKYYCYFTAEPMSEDGGLTSYGLWEDPVRGRGGKESLKAGDPLWPRPAALAYATCARFLGRMERVERIPLHRDLWAYAFLAGDRAVFPLWTTLNEKVEVSFTSPAPLEAFNLMGRKVASHPEGTVKLSLSQEPLWITAPRDQFEVILGAIQKAEHSLLSVDMAASLQAGGQLAAAFQNTREVPVELTCKVLVDGAPAGQDVPLSLGSREVKRVTFPLPGAGDAKQATLLAITKNGKTLSATVPLAPRAIPKATAPFPWNDQALKNSLLVDLGSQVFLSPSAGDLKVANLWKDGEAMPKFHLAWDQQALYVTAVVENVQPNQTAREPRDIWKQDGVMVAADCGNDALPASFNRKGGYDDNDAELAFALTPSGPATYKYHGAPAASPMKCDVRQENGRFIYEITIPWERLAPLQPKEGSVFKMNLLYTHAAKPDSTLTYWFGLTPGIHGGPKDPSQFQSFILSK